jgi:hypothetical protein
VTVPQVTGFGSISSFGQVPKAMPAAAARRAASTTPRLSGAPESAVVALAAPAVEPVAGPDTSNVSYGGFAVPARPTSVRAATDPPARPAASAPPAGATTAADRAREPSVVSAPYFTTALIAFPSGVGKRS